MNTHEVLIAAKALIDTPDKWVRNTFACNEYGLGVDACDTSACRFCSLGAVIRVVGHRVMLGEGAVMAFERANGTGMISFNDTRTHAEVMAAFDKAIEETGKAS